MGKLETRVKHQIRKTKINKALIAAAAVTGGLAVAAIAPGVLGVLGKVLNAQNKLTIKRSLTRLIKTGYVAIQGEIPHRHVSLTPKGERFAAMLGEGRLAPKKPRRWDGKWRILAFDFPERRRALRNHTRDTLVRLGFYRLQDSVWVYPYDCEDLITLFKLDLHIGKDLLYIVADVIEQDMHLQAHFGLVK